MQTAELSETEILANNATLKSAKARIGEVLNVMALGTVDESHVETINMAIDDLTSVKVEFMNLLHEKGREVEC